MRIDFKQLLGGEDNSALKHVPVMLVISSLVLVLNLAFWALGIPEIEAETERLQGEQNQLNGQVSAVDGKIAVLKQNLAGIAEMTSTYKSELAKGTYESENRLKANDILADVKARQVALSWLEPFTEYRLEIAPGSQYAISSEGKGYSWFASPVHINIEMMHDRHFYQFAYDAMNSLNGFALLKKMRLERRSRQEFVKELESKKKAGKLALPIIAELEFLWVTYPSPETNADPVKQGRK